MRGYIWLLLREAQLEHARRFPWAGRVNYIGGLMDACGIWHGFEAANDSAEVHQGGTMDPS